MEFDMVHDIQTAYRKLVTSMSRPGIITSIKEESNKLNIETGCFRSTDVLILMLIDIETGFSIHGKNKESAEQIINQVTYAKSTDINEADFIIICEDVNEEEIKSIIEKAKTGTLNDPHSAATIIIEVESLSNDKQLCLKGPGIKDEAFVKVDLKNSWIEARNRKNAEFPLGVELIFTDRENNLMCFPRTTRVNGKVSI
jgi:alpha-D-ribose 1-methylphosphonate 5-triphosphate synthase subunit PhnH